MRLPDALKSSLRTSKHDAQRLCKSFDNIARSSARRRRMYTTRRFFFAVVCQKTQISGIPNMRLSLPPCSSKLRSADVCFETPIFEFQTLGLRVWGSWEGDGTCVRLMRY